VGSELAVFSYSWYHEHIRDIQIIAYTNVISVLNAQVSKYLWIVEYVFVRFVCVVYMCPCLYRSVVCAYVISLFDILYMIMLLLFSISQHF